MARTTPPANPQPSQQRLLAIRIKRLKNLIDVDIEFDEDRPLTAILGPNGFGKSSILHALAASFFSPMARGGESFRFVDFFPNTPHGVWSGTNFTVAHRYSVVGDVKNESTNVRKETSQWLPIQKYLPKREVYYIGVKSAVPKIETQKTRLRLKYSTNDLIDEKSNEIRIKSGLVFNRDYTKYHANEITRNKKLIGVEFRGLNYSALSMGAGEQRIFEILKIVVMAGKYSLILIDEIDLLLHADALKRFLTILHEYASDDRRKLQIIFTTHRESVLQLEKFISIKHIYQTPIPPHRTFCFSETKPDAIYRLTGQQHRPLEVACEDDVSTAIIDRVATEMGVRPYTEITRFGAADNCFTLIAALQLSGLNLDDSLFVIDGDRFQTQQLQAERMNKVLTGDHHADVVRRQAALSFVRQFAPPAIEPPEKMLHSLIRSVAKTGDHYIDDIIDAALDFEVVGDSHDYVDIIIDRLGGSREVGLSKIVFVASKSTGWAEYTSSIRAWFDSKVNQVTEQYSSNILP